MIPLLEKGKNKGTVPAYCKSNGSLNNTLFKQKVWMPVLGIRYILGFVALLDQRVDKEFLTPDKLEDSIVYSNPKKTSVLPKPK